MLILFSSNCEKALDLLRNSTSSALLQECLPCITPSSEIHQWCSLALGWKQDHYPFLTLPSSCNLEKLLSYIFSSAK